MNAPVFFSVLVVEDNADLAANIADFLEGHGHQVDVAMDGVTGLHLAVTQPHDVIVLDLMLPGIDGLTLCRRLRQDAQSVTPVLMLTARATLDDKAAGFGEGADDYLVKPFDFGELVARVRALQRRPRGVDAPVLTRGGLSLDPARRHVTLNGRLLSVTTAEFHILELLMRRFPAVVERRAIAEHAWRDETEPLGSNVIDVKMSRLRAKLVNAGVRIVTVRGSGFRLEEA